MDTLVKTATKTSDALLTLKGISHAYGTGAASQRPILENIDLELKGNEIVSLLGRSGSGKSTLLRIMAGLIEPTEGTAILDGTPIHGPADGVAMVFQTFALLPWLTVLANVEFGLEAQGVKPEVRRKQALAAIDLIGLDGFENAYPRELPAACGSASDLARALVTRSKTSPDGRAVLRARRS